MSGFEFAPLSEEQKLHRMRLVHRTPMLSDQLRDGRYRGWTRVIDYNVPKGVDLGHMETVERDVTMLSGRHLPIFAAPYDPARATERDWYYFPQIWDDEVRSEVEMVAQTLCSGIEQLAVRNVVQILYLNPKFASGLET